MDFLFYINLPQWSQWRFDYWNISFHRINNYFARVFTKLLPNYLDIHSECRDLSLDWCWPRYGQILSEFRSLNENKYFPIVSALQHSTVIFQNWWQWGPAKCGKLSTMLMWWPNQEEAVKTLSPVSTWQVKFAFMKNVVYEFCQTNF